MTSRMAEHEVQIVLLPVPTQQAPLFIKNTPDFAPNYVQNEEIPFFYKSLIEV